MKKYWIYFLLIGFQVLIGALISSAQTRVISIKNGELTESNIGDSVPDIPLGTVINNSNGKTSLWDFKGKLIILDFWATNCSTCLEGFPKLERLQKEFDSQIQIFLVNTGESKEKIESFYLPGKNRRMPSLPIIADAKHFLQLFPQKREIGYHVWIDGNSNVVLRGGSVNTHSKKIKAFLNGERITFIREQLLSDYEMVEKTQLHLKDNHAISSYSSFIAPFNDSLFGPTAKKFTLVVDTTSGRITNTFFNTTLLNLYQYAADKILADPSIICPKVRVLLDVKDSSKFTYFTNGKTFPEVTDSDIRQCSYSYEQIAKIYFSEKTLASNMLQDLNSYFFPITKAMGRIEKRRVPCYILIRTTKNDKLYTKSIITQSKFFKRDGVEIWKFTNDYLSEIIRFVSDSWKFLKPSDFVLNETGYCSKVDFEIMDNVSSLEQLRNELHKYDLDIIQGIREVEILVIN